MKRKVNRYLTYTLCLCMLCGLLITTGCSKKTNVNVIEDGSTAAVDTAVTTTEDVTEQQVETFAPTSIAYQDWAVEAEPVSGMDNLYELSIPELSQENSQIVSVKGYHEYMLIVVEHADANATLYKVHPLEERIVTSYDLPQGYYYDSNEIYVNAADEIIVRTIMNGEIYILDENLTEKEVIHVKGNIGSEFFLSEDQNYVYYFDYTNLQFYQYDVQKDALNVILTDVEIAPDGYGNLIGLLNGDTCLAFTYLSNEDESDRYEVRDIATGKVYYSGLESISAIYESAGKYSLRRAFDGVEEVLFGDIQNEEPTLLFFQEYEEYYCGRVDVNSMTTVTGYYNDLQDNYVYRLYNMESGFCEKQVAISDSVLSESMILGKAAYSAETDTCVFFLNGTAPRCFVWDLTKDSSASKDEVTYSCALSDVKQTNSERRKELEERAAAMGEEYGVVIIMGDGILECPTVQYEYVVSNNILRIEKTLDVLDKTLSKYPKGMLAQLEQKEYGCSKLHIYLSGGIVPNGEEAIAAAGLYNLYDGFNYMMVDITQFATLETTIYHEMFHAFEYATDWEPGAWDADVWNAFNPEGFEYDNNYIANQENADISYTAGAGEENAYFVDTYAKSYAHEDRARIMEYAMLDANDSQRDLISSEPIQKKLRYMCKVLREYFDTTGWPEQTVWEQACDYRVE